ncbi:hypothetical protein YT1_5441 [Rhodococcus ruber]|nr:hypothetical protein YT1_5441 [Rhodococcus ruber]
MAWWPEPAAGSRTVSSTVLRQLRRRSSGPAVGAWSIGVSFP